ncbi:MAG TPA: pur operon repressor [Clostridiales bacterium UBA8153]|nr:pur operon repressor [Clostridiales bacterium UBA8153]
MGRLKRSERVAVIIRTLVERPSVVFPLAGFAERLQAAKSTISEDLALVRGSFERLGMGRVETLAGAAGGVRFFPFRGRDEAQQVALQLCRRLSEPERILPGGFLYMTDLIFSPHFSMQIGEIFATRFREAEPQYVITVETKGIPLALMTARALNLPLVISRRDARVTEGPSVGINFISGSSGRIQTMSLPKRAVPSGARVLIVDDFMKGGGTARGMVDLLAEFQADVVGIAVLVETLDPPVKLVRDYVSLVELEAVDGAGQNVRVRPGQRLFRGDAG